MSADVNDLTPLTPNHFVVGQFGGELAPEVSENEAVNPKKRWRRIQQLLGQFWRGWRREFLPNLTLGKNGYTRERILKKATLYFS